VVSAATNRIIKVQLDAMGNPTINPPKFVGDTDGIVRVEVGLNPQGIVLNSTDTLAFVENFISRDVSLVDYLVAYAHGDCADQIRSPAASWQF
jgi:hypothetical protein